MESTVALDDSLEAFIRPYREDLMREMSRPLCICDEDMVARRPESNLTRFVSDLFLTEVRSVAAESGEPAPDFALLNVGGMRAPLPKGQLTLANVFQLAPFENSAVVVELDSADVCRLMAHVAEQGGEAISGASLTVGAEGEVEEIKIGGKALRGGMTYRLATLDYLATGGDDFDCLASKGACYHSGIPVRDLIIRHLNQIGAKGEHASAPTNVRVNFINKPEI